MNIQKCIPAEPQIPIFLLFFKWMWPTTTAVTTLLLKSIQVTYDPKKNRKFEHWHCTQNTTATLWNHDFYSAKITWTNYWHPEKGVKALNSLESLETGLFWKDPFPKEPFFRTRTLCIKFQSLNCETRTSVFSRFLANKPISSRTLANLSQGNAGILWQIKAGDLPSFDTYVTWLVVPLKAIRTEDTFGLVQPLGLELVKLQKSLGQNHATRSGSCCPSVEMVSNLRSTLRLQAIPDLQRSYLI